MYEKPLKIRGFGYKRFLRSEVAGSELLCYIHHDFAALIQFMCSLLAKQACFGPGWDENGVT